MRGAIQFMLHDENETHELATVAGPFAKLAGWNVDPVVLEIARGIPNTKVLLVAERAGDTNGWRTFAVAGVLAKPLTFESVRHTVNTLLGRGPGFTPLRILLYYVRALRYSSTRFDQAGTQVFSTGQPVQNLGLIAYIPRLREIAAFGQSNSCAANRTLRSNAVVGHVAALRWTARCRDEPANAAEKLRDFPNKAVRVRQMEDCTRRENDD
jgi:hypothetical protein